eukprot:3936126-Rhodomonas_salina.2
MGGDWEPTGLVVCGGQDDQMGMRRDSTKHAGSLDRLHTVFHTLNAQTGFSPAQKSWGWGRAAGRGWLMKVGCRGGEGERYSS